MPKIRLYLDENISYSVSEGLKRREIEACSAKEANNLGISDEKQLEFAIKQKAVLVTNDADFLRMVKKRNLAHFGIIYFDQDKYGIGEIIRKIEELTTILEPEDFTNRIEFL